ncbi:MAG: Zn-ribbon domain-containing OB-fold protein [Myxococcota bacterium]|jgi:hypothetical protein
MRSILPEDWTLPAVDELNEAFFTSGRILLQSCAGCGTIQHPPEEICHRCQGTEFETRESSGRGTVYSYTVIHHPAHPKLAQSVPYAVVLVSLDDFPDVRITGNVLNRAFDGVSIGLPVRAVWEEIKTKNGAVYRLPQWEVVE